MKSAPICPAWKKICLTCPLVSSQGRIDGGFGPQEVRMELHPERQNTRKYAESRFKAI
jgi:hypothetical protein